MKSRLGLVLLVTMAVSSLAVHAGEPRLQIAVRSEVDRPFQGWGKAPLREHGRTYTLIYAKEAKSEMRLYRPISPETVAKALVVELNKQGFEALPWNESPEILLGVSYGRAFLRNPYLKDNIAFGNMISLTGVSGLEYFTRMRTEPGFQMKVQDAENEKLFVRIIAWDNPAKQPGYDPDQKVKLHEVWRTTVLIDDPGNRDLNDYVEKMLAAASPLFDHPTKDEEAFVTTALPKANVRMGEAKEVPDQPGDNEAEK